MKNILIKMATMTLLLATVFTCSACTCTATDDGAEKDSVAYNVGAVLGYTNNSAIVDLKMIPELQLASYPDSSYVCVLPCAEPQLLCSDTIPNPGGNGYSKKMVQRLEAGIQAEMESKIQEAAVPATPEVDICAAMEMAVRGIRSNEREDGENTKNILVIYSSCLGTHGMIQMQHTSLAELDVESSVANLAQRMGMDLSGIAVVVYGCGDVAGDVQTPLSSMEKKNLKAFYQSLFEALGADEIRFSEKIPPSGSYNFDQPVTAVPTEEEISGLDIVNTENLEQEEIGGALSNGQILSIDVRFKGDTTELLDPEEAEQKLDSIMRYMDDHPDASLLVCGTTANTGNETDCISFSGERADAIREQLIRSGTDGDRIRILGCGYSCSLLYRPDRNPDGSFIENAAAYNRSVKVVDLSSPIAQQILNGQQEGRG